MIEFLKGEKICLRPFLKKDLSEDYLRWINDRENDCYTEHAQFPHSLEQLKKYAENKWADPSSLWLAIIDLSNDKHVGNIEICDIDTIHGVCEYKILLDKSVHGKGFAKEASLLLLDHVFNVLNLYRVNLGVHQDNEAAISLYKKLGFVEEGRKREAFLRDGERKDLIVMGLLANDYKKARKD